MLLLLLAIVPVVTVVTFSVLQWQSLTDDLDAIEEDLAPVTAAHLAYAFLDRGSHSLLLREAAALPDIGPEFVERAARDAETFEADIEVRYDAFVDEIEDLATSLGDSPERTLALTDFAYELIVQSLGNHEIGTSTPATLNQVLAESRTRFVDIALPRVSSGADWLRDDEDHLFGLIQLDADHDQDLLRVMVDSGVIEELHLSNPRRLRWDPEASAWSPDGITAGSAAIGISDFAQGSLIATDNPLTPPIVEMASISTNLIEPDRRASLITRSLDDDQALRASIDEAHVAAVNALLAERHRLERGRRIATAFGMLMTLLGISLFSLVVNEVRERRRVRRAHDASLEQMRELAHRDALTGLHNRRWIEATLDDLLAGQRPTVIASVDVDRFKGVNDVWGHPVGDRVLRTMADRLSAAASLHGLEVARFGGDEFLVMGSVDASTSRAAIADVGAGLLAAFHEPIAIGDRELEVHGSIGITSSTETATTRSLLLEADLALLAAKREGRNRVAVHDPQGNDVLDLVRALPIAFARDEFSMELQPIVRATTGGVHHYEALARWRRTDGTTVPPDVFVPLIESLALTSKLTAAIVAAVGRVASRTPGLPRIFINVSPVEFEVPGLCDRLLAAIEQADLPPSAIGIEVTERAAIGDLSGFEAELARLRDVGIVVAIDDFGAGYSPLGYLRNLPIDMLKIDRTLIADIDIDTGARTMLRGIIGFAHSLGLTLVAEGVERSAELDVLVTEGVELVQGWLTGRPAPPSAIQAQHLRDNAKVVPPEPVDPPTIMPTR